MEIRAREQANDWQREIDPVTGRITIFYRARMIPSASAGELAREVAGDMTDVMLTPQIADRLRNEGRREVIDTMRPIFEEIGRRTGIELP